jgi:hypothetical protein
MKLYDVVQSVVGNEHMEHLFNNPFVFNGFN